MVSPACAQKMHPEGALCGRPQSTLQTLVGWRPPSLRKREAKSSDLSQQGTSLRGLDQSQALMKPGKASSRPLVPMAPHFPQSPFQYGTEGRLQGIGLKQCRSGVKRPYPPFPDPRKIPCPERADSPPTHRALKPPSFLSYSSPSQGKKRGTQTFQLRSGVGG